MGTFFSLSKSGTSLGLYISEIALLLFGVLLVVGLIGEYAKSDRWKKHVRLFEMFVIIGVAGELLADGGIFLFSSHLQTIADLEIADLNRQAGEFSLQIAQANERAAQAEATAKKFEAQIADAQLAAAEAKRESVEIEQGLAGRQLTPRDATALRDRLVALRGQQRVWVGFRNGDAEAEVFAWDIAKALYDAKWNVNSPGGTMLIAPLGLPYQPDRYTVKTGIDVTSTEIHRASSEALAAALRDRGFDAQAGVTPHPSSEDRMDVFIWARPRGAQGEAKLNLEAPKKKQAQSSQTAK